MMFSKQRLGHHHRYIQHHDISQPLSKKAHAETQRKVPGQADKYEGIVEQTKIMELAYFDAAQEKMISYTAFNELLPDNEHNAGCMHVKNHKVDKTNTDNNNMKAENVTSASQLLHTPSSYPPICGVGSPPKSNLDFVCGSTLRLNRHSPGYVAEPLTKRSCIATYEPLKSNIYKKKRKNKLDLRVNTKLSSIQEVNEPQIISSLSYLCPSACKENQESVEQEIAQDQTLFDEDDEGYEDNTKTAEAIPEIPVAAAKIISKEHELNGQATETQPALHVTASHAIIATLALRPRMLDLYTNPIWHNTAFLASTLCFPISNRIARIPGTPSPIARHYLRREADSILNIILRSVQKGNVTYLPGLTSDLYRMLNVLVQEEQADEMVRKLGSVLYLLGEMQGAKTN